MLGCGCINFCVVLLYFCVFMILVEVVGWLWLCDFFDRLMCRFGILLIVVFFLDFLEVLKIGLLCCEWQGRFDDKFYVEVELEVGVEYFFVVLRLYEFGVFLYVLEIKFVFLVFFVSLLVLLMICWVICIELFCDLVFLFFVIGLLRCLGYFVMLNMYCSRF